MKIRTKNELKDFLDKDMGWRKTELSSILSNVKTSESKKLQLALRTSVLLLYAHWEGFVKKACECYLNYVSNQNLELQELKDNFLAIALKQKISGFTGTNNASQHCEFVRYFKNNLNEQSNIRSENVISAKSNLNSIVLKQILVSVGLDYSLFETKSNLIDEKLLKYRNNIILPKYWTTA